MDYKLVLKFKKYPESKPSVRDGYISNSIPCATIVKDNCDKIYTLYESIYFVETDEFDVMEHETVLAYACKPDSNKLIELLNSTHETILVTKQYLERLEHSDNFLSALREAGVDNWCGYDEAREIMSRNEDED